jgi:type IV pilus assembly protein PilW
MKLLSKQTGISLVEVLVALVISLFLLGGIVQVYVGNKVTFKFTNALAEVQENGRFALDLMSQDLRLANQWGCIAFDPTDTTNVNDTLNGTHPGYDADFHDFLSPTVTLPGAIAGTNNAGLNGSDMLVVRGGKPGQTNVEGPFTAATTQSLNVNPIGSIGAGDIILVARCGEYLLNIPEADILSVSSVDTTNPVQTVINVAANKSQQFQNDAMVIELQTVTYTIGLAASGNGELALFRQEFNGIVEELVEGVQDMQVLYGIDSDNDQFPNQYVTSDNVPNFNAVVSLRIMLLIHSIDDFVTEAPQTYTFNGVLTTPADRRLRQVFTTTIALRNRIG